MKLAAFQPRFLLESVEGGERLGRFSFIGFGDALEGRLDDGGLLGGGGRSAPPPDPAAVPGRASGRWGALGAACERGGAAGGLARRAGAGATTAAGDQRSASGWRPGRLCSLRRGAPLRAAAGRTLPLRGGP